MRVFLIAIITMFIELALYLVIFHRTTSTQSNIFQTYDDVPSIQNDETALESLFKSMNVLALPKPMNATRGSFKENDLPFISTISEKINPLSDKQKLNYAENFFDIMNRSRSECLPEKECSRCLWKDKKESACKRCEKYCSCYCQALCNRKVKDKFIPKELTVRPPKYARDSPRLIPRIVHQTYFEEINPKKYPKLARLRQSFNQSGWEYRFYTDHDIDNFISTHFPPEVKQAYDALIPGAFKADLFRYCVLLIHGGVYADIDILLEANLDLVVEPDIGFMVPQDAVPGRKTDTMMCLWNGFMAAAPGHPFLAKTIETVVNNVRNRFNSIDIDHMFCPGPELNVLHSYALLFIGGPCILGAMVNKLLGRDMQTSFRAGEIDMVGQNETIDVATIPGRTIILSQNKEDMGACRFTFVEKNLIVAATDLPGDDEGKDLDDAPQHYSNTLLSDAIYGLQNVYVDNEKANEEIRILVQT